MACPYLSFLETNLFKYLLLWAVLFCPSGTGLTPPPLCRFSFTIGRLKQKYKIPLDDSSQKMKSELIRETQGQRPARTLFKVHLHIRRHAYTQRAHIICSSKNKHLSCFHILALVNNAYSIFLCLLYHETRFFSEHF